jgi:hypothetical protein
VLLERSLWATIVILFALSLHRAFIANINWDEFYYLSQVHQYRNGLLSLPLQTLHVHLFGWLPFVSDNEVYQIFAARGFLWLMSIVSGVLIFNVARNFCSKEASLLSVLFYAGFSYVVDHGLSFRYDPICAFLFLASLYMLLCAGGSRFRIAISGFLMAVAMMVSIKSVFYFGTIGAIFLTLFLLEPNRRVVIKNALVFAAVFSGSLLVLYQAHRYALASDTLIDPSAYVRSSGSKTLLSTPFLPRINFIINALSQNGPIWVFIFLGLAKAVYGAFKGPDRKSALILVSFAAPLLSLLFYRNAYPYFYVFLMPAVVVLGGVFADVLIASFRRSSSKVVLLVFAGTVLMISGSVLGDYIRKLPDQTAAQAQIVALVHRMFPEPVPYIDRNSMISSYPTAGFLMSTWNMESYVARNSPVMEGLIQGKQPQFLIANSCALDILQRQVYEETLCHYRLLDQDLEALRANFVHHWGAVYVAGKTFELRAQSEPEEFEILISGTYTLEADAGVSIDGAPHRPGDQVHLSQGGHTIVATDAATDAVLRFGVNLPQPGHEPSSLPIYVQL